MDTDREHHRERATGTDRTIKIRAPRQIAGEGTIFAINRCAGEVDRGVHDEVGTIGWCSDIDGRSRIGVDRDGDGSRTRLAMTVGDRGGDGVDTDGQRRGLERRLELPEPGRKKVFRVIVLREVTRPIERERALPSARC